MLVLFHRLCAARYRDSGGQTGSWFTELASLTVTATVSAAICGYRSGPQVARTTFSWCSKGMWRKVPERVISESDMTLCNCSYGSSLSIWSLKDDIKRTCLHLLNLHGLKQWHLLHHFSQLSQQNAWAGCWRPGPLRLTVTHWNGATPSLPRLLLPSHSFEVVADCAQTT